MPRNDQCPYFYLYPDDFTSDRNVEAMTTEGVGAYFLLVCKSWFENPVASIPDDDRILARWSRLSPEQWSECKASVLAAFKMGKDGRWYQKRLRLEFEKLRRIKKSRSEAGLAGAIARHAKPKEDNELNGKCTAAPQQTQDFAILDACHTVLESSSSVCVSSSLKEETKNVLGNGDRFDEFWAIAVYAGLKLSDTVKTKTLREWLNLLPGEDEMAISGYLHQVQTRRTTYIQMPQNFLGERPWRFANGTRHAPDPIKLAKGDESQLEANKRFLRSKR